MVISSNSEYNQTERQNAANKMSQLICEKLRELQITCKTIEWIEPKVHPIIRNKLPKDFFKSCIKQSVGVLALGKVIYIYTLYIYVYIF